MAFDPPRPEQVIGYRYLWWSGHRKGHAEGVKDRSCALSLCGQEPLAGETCVNVLPITHTRPYDTEESVELLTQWKQHTGLDAQPSWIMTSELNHFEWPGVDVRGTSTEDISYGFLLTRSRRGCRKLSASVFARIVDAH